MDLINIPEDKSKINNKYGFNTNENLPNLSNKEKNNSIPQKNNDIKKPIENNALKDKTEINKSEIQANISNKQDLSNKKNNSVDNGEKIVFGLNDKGQKMYMPESSRYYNTLVIGNKGTGKTEGLLPVLLEQDFKNKNYGCTVIVSKNEVAYNLYALAKNYKRDVIILKPSISNEISNNFLWKREYSYDYINEYIINYKEAIKKKQIVIIDMEILKHKSDGLKAVAMLLLQLQLDMQETDITQKKPHFLYVDDGQYYLPFLEYLFAFGDNYNLGITLFLQSRKQLFRNGKDYSIMVDNNIRNILLLNSLEKNDVLYYKDRFYEQKQSNQFYNREITEILYETINANNKRKCGLANYSTLQTIDWNIVNNKAKSIRSRLLKEKRKELEKAVLLAIKSKYEYKEDEYYIEDGNEIELTAEESNGITEIEKELMEALSPEDFDNYEDIGEPIPIDISLIEDDLTLIEDDVITTDISTDNLDIKNHVEDLKKELPDKKMDKKEKVGFKEEKIKEIIRIKEKSTKRNVSTKIFNNLVSDIDYCDDNFDFKFE